MTPAPITLATLPKRGRGRPSKADQKLRDELKLRQLRQKQKKAETPAERLARIAERFTAMYRLTQGMIAQRHPRSIIVSGAAGTGKSFTIEELLNAAQEQNKIRYLSIRGTVTGVNLFKLLFEYSQKTDILLIDDSDAIYEDEDAMNILKAALDTSKVRKISWLADSNSLTANNVPKTFIYEGTMIFITNIDFQTIVDYQKHKMIPHFKALMSRSIYLDLKLHDPEDLLVWIRHMVARNHILVKNDCTHDQEEMALKWLDKNWTHCRELSLRTVLKLGQFMINSPTNWESFARVTLLR